jgi:AcrR family transcriptional regulator
VRHENTKKGEQMTARIADKRAQAGRPVVLPEAERRGLILDAAACVFLARGYAASTMHAIALQARMSKKTLYQVFPSKLALFDALLENRIFQGAALPAREACSQQESLSRLLFSIAETLLRPDRTALIRLIITDGQAFPELATAFERLKMPNKLNALAAWFEREMQAGHLPSRDPFETSHLLFGMAIAEPMLQALCRAPAPLGTCPLEERIPRAVAIFLSGLTAP